ncbi:Cytochrome P450 [Penicillium occitanis (nom. inval.)]|nr:Cytochrome P450 [Penicillium occitanis (nom. inval.)]PCG90485.1 hypothetical protein PENOC_101760 [Penicillium occitanis (nom. inval.)]
MEGHGRIVLFPWPLPMTLVLLGLFVIFFLSSIIYNRWFHPLSKYPGPFLWTVFRWPFAWSLQSGNLVHDTKRFHDRYGKIVRLAPNEVSFIDPQAWSDIYGHHKKDHKEFIKNPIWAQPAPNGVLSLINAKEKDHPRMRKPFVPAFSVKALKDQEHIIQQYIDLLMKQLTRHANSDLPIVDMKDYYSWTTFDIIGDLGFGESFDCLRRETYHDWVSFLFGHLKDGALQASINFYPWIASILFALMPKSAYRAAKAHFELSSQKVRRRMRTETDRKDILSYVLSLKEEKRLTIPELEATSSIIILAGSESTSTMLTATTNFLLRNPEKLEKLVQEVRSTFHSELQITLASTDCLEYLRAVFQEVFRLAPPVPTQIPRIVPPEGGSVCGHNLPGNTFVGVPQFAAYRYPGHFIFPDRFIPERWLSKESEMFYPSHSDPVFHSATFQNDCHAVVQPFSVGPRNCIGVNLAFAEMRLVMARLLYNFDLNIPRKRDAQGNTLVDHEEYSVFESQKTYALWEREPLRVELSLVQ